MCIYTISIDRANVWPEYKAPLMSGQVESILCTHNMLACTCPALKLEIGTVTQCSI